jgi:FkbM family methyltransferase
MLRFGGYKGRIVSFEPLSGAHEKLLKASGNDPLWRIAPRMAIGDTDGEIEINISANSVSSSLAPLLPSAANSAANATYIGREKVRIAKLDTIATAFVAPEDVVFLKIDAQGYELPVLEGAGKLLPRVQGLQLELSLSPLYEGEVFYLDMIKKIYDLGFELHGMFPAFTDVATGRMLQADGIFFRPDQK